MFRFIGIFCCLTISAFAQAPDGKALFAAKCAMCHSADGDKRAPLPEVLQQRPNESIVVALEAGAMRSQGAGLTSAERRAVADFLSPRTAASEQPIRENSCPANRPLANLNGWNGWGVDLVNSRLQSTAAAGLRADDIPKLKVKWAFGLPYEVTVEAQPTVVGGRLFFGSATGAVYSLDARTGCQYWMFKADTRMRTAINVERIGLGQYAAYFGDSETNVYAVNAQTGKLIWRTRLDDASDGRHHRYAEVLSRTGSTSACVRLPKRSPRAIPSIPAALFAAVWLRSMRPTAKWRGRRSPFPIPPSRTKMSSAGTQLFGPSGAGIWDSPTIDVKRNLVYAGTGNNYSDPPTSTSDAILAFDLDFRFHEMVEAIDRRRMERELRPPRQAELPRQSRSRRGHRRIAHSEDPAGR